MPQETLQPLDYLTFIQQQYPPERFRFWELFSYNDNGDLIMNGLNVARVARDKGTPLRITFPEIVTIRADEWTTLSQAVAEDVGYDPENIGYNYATKASPTATTVAGVLAAKGWHLEISSEQDLWNFKEWEKTPELRRLLKSRQILCNGYKPHPARYNRPNPNPPEDSDDEIVYEGEHRQVRRREGQAYAELIANFAARGYNMVPIIDTLDELDYLGQPGIIPPMKVGLRSKSYGLVKANNDKEGLVSRFGLTEDQLFEGAARIATIKHLTLDTYHAMIDANAKIDPEIMVHSLLQEADIFFRLRSLYPTLNTFNMGGGIPPLGFGYNHERFLTLFYSGMKELAVRYEQEQPRIVHEFGSLVAAEAGVYVTSITSEKVNDSSGVPWGITDGSFMRAVIDMILIGKDDYVILAANHANHPTKPMRLGDRTCDSDGFARTQNDNVVPMLDTNGIEPNYGGDVFVAVQGVEAYEKTLAGFSGVGHCGLLEPVEVIAYRGADGKMHCYVEEQKTLEDAARILGFKKEYVPIVMAILGMGRK